MAKKTAAERKLSSENHLTSLNFKVNTYLPLVEDWTNARFQEARDIAIRTQILGALCETTLELPRLECKKYFEELDIWDHVSPNERKYLLIDEPSEQSLIDMSWKIESNYVLFWALGFVDRLIEPIELQELHEKIRTDFSSAENFFSSAKLRNAEEILDECDLIYRLHNAVRNCVFNNQDIPQNYHPAIVYERHYALNWLICYQDDWDEITTDT